MNTDTRTTLTLKASELRLGDEVRLFEGTYGGGTVVNIEDEEVVIVRPFIHIGDFVCTGGVLHYTGLETVKVWRESDRTFEVSAERRRYLERHPLK